MLAVRGGVSIFHRVIRGGFTGKVIIEQKTSRIQRISHVDGGGVGRMITFKSEQVRRT